MIIFRYLLWIVLLAFSYSGYHVVLVTTKSKKGCSGTRLDDETRSTKLGKLTDTQENKRREELSDLNSVDFTATCEPYSQEAVPGKYLPIAIQ